MKNIPKSIRMISISMILLIAFIAAGFLLKKQSTLTNNNISSEAISENYTPEVLTEEITLTPFTEILETSVVTETPTPETTITTSANSTVDDDEERKIQLALLLDTSSSMDGLIEQAKSQLWKIVNELTKAKSDGSSPSFEIALYEYGNDRLSRSEGYIRQISPLSTDLDAVSIALFALRTNGGSEYCGDVINRATEKLEWSKSEKDIKMIFIAGNEPFTQGSISYEAACGDARSNDIIINTIHCGNYEEGIRGKWQSGATIGGGDYMSIEQNTRTVYVQTPYDDKINILSIDLNNTYIYYGSQGRTKKLEQTQADEQAKSYTKSNLAIRNSVKVSSFYKNARWDLVDASDATDFDITKVDKSTLPKELQNMTNEQLEAFIVAQKAEREKLKKQIGELNKQRELHIAENKTEGEESVETSMVNALKKQAEAKNYSW